MPQEWHPPGLLAAEVPTTNSSKALPQPLTQPETAGTREGSLVCADSLGGGNGSWVTAGTGEANRSYATKLGGYEGEAKSNSEEPGAQGCHSPMASPFQGCQTTNTQVAPMIPTKSRQQSGLACPMLWVDREGNPPGRSGQPQTNRYLNKGGAHLLSNKNTPIFKSIHS